MLIDDVRTLTAEVAAVKRQVESHVQELTKDRDKQALLAAFYLEGVEKAQKEIETLKRSSDIHFTGWKGAVRRAEKAEADLKAARERATKYVHIQKSDAMCIAHLEGRGDAAEARVKELQHRLALKARVVDGYEQQLELAHEKIRELLGGK